MYIHSKFRQAGSARVILADIKKRFTPKGEKKMTGRLEGLFLSQYSNIASSKKFGKQ
jgi:hypothetical protein